MPLWRFECFNGTIWEAPTFMELEKALKLFIKVTKLTQMDIKIIKNLH